MTRSPLRRVPGGIPPPLGQNKDPGKHNFKRKEINLCFFGYASEEEDETILKRNNKGRDGRVGPKASIAEGGPLGKA